MYPADRKYSREHEWARLERDEVVVGITHYAQAELGDVVYVELPPMGARLQHGGEFGAVESVKAVSALYAPVSGEVTAVNDEVVKQPELVNMDPHGAGWMIRIRPASAGQLDELLSAVAYEQLVNELRA
ncbi:MAG: glycine cleavage system protein GcvH [Actinobacteria bacterium]|nr:glycine cleavage system protein GcvH [Actinomycetota bacterium]